MIAMGLTAFVAAALGPSYPMLLVFLLVMGRASRITSVAAPRYTTSRDLTEQTRGSSQLDFEEVLPLLLREMGYAYRTTLEQRRIPPEEYELSA